MDQQCGMKARALGKDEILFLLDLISKKKVITSKATNATNNKLKEEAWHTIAQEFCAMAGERRRPEQLRLKWENLKKAARKRNASIRHNNLKTGGGKMYIAPDEVLDRVASMLGATCSGFTVEFGGDGTLSPPVATSIVEVYDVEPQPLPELIPQAIINDNTMVMGEDGSLESGGPRNECNVAQKKFLFNTPKSSLNKRRKLEDELKAAQKEKELAMAAYFRAKTKKVEYEYIKLQLDKEKLQSENTKLKLEIENLKK